MAWRGEDREEEESAGRASGLGPRSPPGGSGQSRSSVAVGGRERCAWGAVQGPPSEPHLSSPYWILKAANRNLLHRF